MIAILLACPACRTKISSSAHSCPKCGQPLTDVWEAKGRKRRKWRRIGQAVVFIPLAAVFGAALIAINTGPDKGRSAPLTPATVESSNGKAPVRALAFRTSYGSGIGLYVKIRAKTLDLGGLKVRVICPADGGGEVLAELNGEYIAMNGLARDWAASKVFWAVLEAEITPISDLDYPDNLPKRFEVLEPHVVAVSRVGSEMCPLASPAAESRLKAIQRAVEGFSTNARNLGIADR